MATIAPITSPMAIVVDNILRYFIRSEKIHDFKSFILKHPTSLNHALPLAAGLGSSTAVSMLLDIGADVNSVYCGASTLYLAAQHGEVIIIKMLWPSNIDMLCYSSSI
jgi:hypothetical protein